MNKSFILALSAVTIVSCGTANVASESSLPIESTTDNEVSIGYGSISKNVNTFAVNEAKMSDSESMIYNDMYDYLRNKVPGVEVSNDTGNGGIPKITIRGEKTIGIGIEQNPVFVLDGETIQDINQIHPTNVYSVQVLKGAAASSYGSRSANGVILITSKFAHETAEREAAAKKAAKLEKKAAKKK